MKAILTALLGAVLATMGVPKGVRLPDAQMVRYDECAAAPNVGEVRKCGPLVKCEKGP